MGMALARTPVDPADPRAEAAMDAVWARVTEATEGWMRVGIEAATLAGMAWGFGRAREDLREEAIEAVTYRPPAFFGEPPSGPDVLPTRTIGGRELPDLRGSPFGLENPRAVAAAEQHAAELVRNVDDVTRDRLRRITADARSLGQSNDRLAARIRGEFPRMAVARPQAHIRDRAHLIAATETSFAYSRGQRLAADASAAAGLAMVHSWLTVGDGAVDAVCDGNEAADELPMADAFPSGHDYPPAHPGCRCTVQYRALTSAERGLVPPTPAPTPAEPWTDWEAGAVRATAGDGRERGASWTTAGQFLGETKGAKASVAIEDRALALMRAGQGQRVITTHSHPRDSIIHKTMDAPREVMARSFSTGDVDIALQYGLAEMRAVTDDYVHIIRTTGPWSAAKRRLVKKLYRQEVAKAEQRFFTEWEEARLAGRRIEWRDTAHDAWQVLADDYGLAYERHARP